MAFWTVARTNFGHDRQAAENVAFAGFEVFAPRTRTLIGARWRTGPLFPSYIFIRIIDRWRMIERTIGVLAIVKAGAAPAVCPDAEIAKLLARADGDGMIRLNARPPGMINGAPIPPGARVTIAAGPFVGFDAIYQGMSASDRELVLIELLGRQTRVSIAAGAIHA
jgi:transcriptional antiterminator RfaH